MLCAPRRSDEEWEGPGSKPLVRPGEAEHVKRARLERLLQRIPDVVADMKARLAEAKCVVEPAIQISY